MHESRSAHHQHVPNIGVNITCTINVAGDPARAAVDPPQTGA
jgi:hypothetical protein